MDKKKLGKRIGAGVIAFIGAVSASVITVESYLKNKYSEIKPNAQIVKEAEDLEVDCGYMNMYEDQHLSLGISPGDPLIIEYDSKMPSCEVELIGEVVDYCDKIFKTIDSEYSFKLISSDDNGVNKPTISIKNGDIKLTVENGHYEGLNNYLRYANDDKSVIIDSKITIDWDSIQSKEKDYQYYVILHELGHSFGLGDVYCYGEQRCVDYNYGTTVMNVMDHSINQFYPNDYAILQSLYSREYLKQESYDEALVLMQEKIDAYTEYFYEQVADKLRENNEGYFGNIDRESLENLNYQWTRTDLNGNIKTFNIDIKDGIYNFTISDDAGNILEQSSSKTVYADGMLFATEVVIEDTKNYQESYEYECGSKMMILIAPTSDGKILIQDNLYNYDKMVKINENKNTNKR